MRQRMFAFYNSFGKKAIVGYIGNWPPCEVAAFANQAAALWAPG